jgi:hypothetical protein
VRCDAVNIGARFRLTLPRADEVRYAAVAGSSDVVVQRPHRAPPLLVARSIGLERLLESLVKRRQFARLLVAPVLGLAPSAGAFSHLRIVSRDELGMLAISLTDLFWPLRIRLTLSIISIVIILVPAA